MVVQLVDYPTIRMLTFDTRFDTFYEYVLKISLRRLNYSEAFVILLAEKSGPNANVIGSR